MAGRAKADCGANLIEHSYALNGAWFTPVARELIAEAEARESGNPHSMTAMGAELSFMVP
jgi:hypothetical protein